MDLPRVVVTGLGAVTPLGNSVNETWTNAKNGVSGARLITKFDTENFKTKFACEVKDFDPKSRLDRNEIRKSDLFIQYALYSASEAMEDSALDIANMDQLDVGVIWGSGQGGMTTFEEELKGFIDNNMVPRFNPFFIPKMITNMASGMISIKYGLMGINFTTVSACATANTAIMDAFNYIRLGKAKAIVTGGSEAPISPASIGGFNALRALSTHNDEPEAASRPWDVDRDGFVMGEGGVALILEDYEHAKARGANIYAEVVGASMTADAHHMTASHPEGKGAFEAMNIAIKEAGINFEQIDYLNAHATSTPVGDIPEIMAIAKHLGSGKNNMHIGATKSMTGHLLGAAGGVESVFSIMALKEGIMAPTINTTNIEESIPGNINLILGEAVEKEMTYAMSNTFGFGGHNATLIFKKV